MNILKNDIKDVVIATAKGIVSTTPLVGGLLSEYIGLTKEKIADKRMREWIKIVEIKIAKLECDIDKLSDNEFFYSCVQTATFNVLKTHQNQKREFFADALYNAFAINDISEEKKLMFFSLLDRYILSTIKLLKYYSENHYNEDNLGLCSPW